MKTSLRICSTKGCGNPTAYSSWCWVCIRETDAHDYNLDDLETMDCD